jgi:hypothetical protein
MTSINYNCEEAPGETTTYAGGGWSNDFVPLQWNVANASFIADPSGTVDAVMGFSSGPASDFSDLGPIIRFAPNGVVDARNGDHYEAVEDAPYGSNHYLISMQIDWDYHTYSARIRPWYFTGTEYTIADHYAFRSEQSALSHADTLARFVDSPTGNVGVCHYYGQGPCTISYADSGGWPTTPIASQQGAFHFEVDATPIPPTWDNTALVDAVVGLSNGVPSDFTDLAAIVRFSPDGVIDVRDGDQYRADEALPYTPGQTYQLAFDVDLATHRYSVTVTPWGNPPHQLATDYAFRTEQQGATSLDRLAQFVDGTPGGVKTCNLFASY